MSQFAGNVGSVRQCYNIAINNNYDYFSIQNGGECFLSNNLTRATVYGLCGHDCGLSGCGNVNCTCSARLCASREQCGDGFGNALYQVADINSAIVTPVAVIATGSSTSTASVTPFNATYLGNIIILMLCYII
jgi:hypothetical protein